MDCHEEVAILKRRLSRLVGLEKLDADVVGQRLRVKYDAAKISTDVIADAVAQTGMRAWLEHEAPAPPRNDWRTHTVIASSVLLAAGMAGHPKRRRIHVPRAAQHAGRSGLPEYDGAPTARSANRDHRHEVAPTL